MTQAYLLALLVSLTIAPENRCAPYDSEDYSYTASVELQSVIRQGFMGDPYIGERLDNIGQTDIEHIVARSEAHDSGMCGRGADAKRAFARDLLNLTTSIPEVNRNEKSDKDAAEWMPIKNHCWYISRIIQVKSKWGLSVDQAEHDALDLALEYCVTFTAEFE